MYVHILCYLDSTKFETMVALYKCQDMKKKKHLHSPLPSFIKTPLHSWNFAPSRSLSLAFTLFHSLTLSLVQLCRDILSFFSESSDLSLVLLQILLRAECIKNSLHGEWHKRLIFIILYYSVSYIVIYHDMTESVSNPGMPAYKQTIMSL